jgi:hypothetical protein
MLNQNDWNVMLPTALWAYRTTYKVSTQHTPYELVYWLMPLIITYQIYSPNQMNTC